MPRVSADGDTRESSGAVRVVCIGDTHGEHRRMTLPDGDIALFAGDITRDGSLESLRAFDARLGELPHTHRIVVAGNHDTCFADVPNEARAALSNATYLEDETVERLGLRIYGAPWQPRLAETESSPFAFDLPRGEPLADKWERIPTDVDILLTHSPPHGIRDEIYTGDRIGCRALASRLDRVSPLLHVFGHVHEMPGTERADGRVSVNAATPGGYGTVAVFDIQPGGAVETIQSGDDLPDWIRERIRERRERARRG